MLIRTVLVCDDVAVLHDWREMLLRFPELAIAETGNEPENALRLCEQQAVDVIFIDLEINNAIELVAAIRQVNLNIIIVVVSACSDYAVKAFEMNAQDYLVKPIPPERLSLTVKKLNYLVRLRQAVAGVTPIEAIPGKNNGRIYLLKVQDILYFTTIGRNVFAVSANGLYKLQGSLAYWEKHLPAEKFFRCHNGYIVNLSKIEYIAPFFKNAYSIKITGSAEPVPVSRTFAKRLKQRVLLKA